VGVGGNDRRGRGLEVGEICLQKWNPWPENLYESKEKAVQVPYMTTGTVYDDKRRNAGAPGDCD